MKSYRNCTCPCHMGAVLVHPVPCCDGIGSPFVIKKLISRRLVRHD
jgi:hypothetical protein